MEYRKILRTQADNLRFEILHPTLGNSERVGDHEAVDRGRCALFERYSRCLMDLVGEELRSVGGWHVASAKDDPGIWHWDTIDRLFVFDYCGWVDFALRPALTDPAMYCRIKMHLDPELDLDVELARLGKQAAMYRDGTATMKQWIIGRMRDEVHLDRSPPTEEGYEFVERILLDQKSADAFAAEMDNPSPPNAALQALFQPAFKPWPPNEPRRYNGSGEPCDMWTGPCCCGATHKEGK